MSSGKSSITYDFTHLECSLMFEIPKQIYGQEMEVETADVDCWVVDVEGVVLWVKDEIKRCSCVVDLAKLRGH